MSTLDERCKKFATRNYINSDGEVVATIVDAEVYQNALIVAQTIQKEMIEKACEWMKDNGCFSYLQEGDKTLEDVEINFLKAMEDEL